MFQLTSEEEDFLTRMGFVKQVNGYDVPYYIKTEDNWSSGQLWVNIAGFGTDKLYVSFSEDGQPHFDLYMNLYEHSLLSFTREELIPELRKMGYGMLTSYSVKSR